MNMKFMKAFLVSCVVATLLATPTVLWADTSNVAPDQATAREADNHLSTFEWQAAKVSRDAERLWSLSRNYQTSWESHADSLGTLREDINNMGKLLGELEAMKPRAEAVHHLAIENARLHLVALAEETGKAIELIRPGSRNLGTPEYKETVTNLSLHADGLYQTVDTIVDYHDASDRLLSLEAPHPGSVN
jgi:hypothetical protein